LGAPSVVPRQGIGHDPQAPQLDDDLLPLGQKLWPKRLQLPYEIPPGLGAQGRLQRVVVCGGQPEVDGSLDVIETPIEQAIQDGVHNILLPKTTTKRSKSCPERAGHREVSTIRSGVNFLGNFSKWLLDIFYMNIMVPRENHVAYANIFDGGGGILKVEVRVWGIFPIKTISASLSHGLLLN